VSLSEIEIRVLGALLEKERTTPEAYPLSTNALVLACNQKTSRDPVTDYGPLEVEEALRSLSDKGLAESFRGERALKHRHRLEEALEVRPSDLAVLAVLMLRGPQTPGELRVRTERYTHFPDVAALEASLERLQAHRPPLVRNYGRGPGQSQDRWGHLLGADPEKLRPRVRSPEPTARPEDEVAALRREVAALRRQVERLLDHVGLEEG